MKQHFHETKAFRYGKHPDQHFTLGRQDDGNVGGTIVLVHGGYWRQRIDASVMDPMMKSILASGLDVANVEYRRGPEHPWPVPSDDVASAIRSVRKTQLLDGRCGPIILIGHSVGGQLSLLNADRADAVVALAPVTDVVRIYDESLGDLAAKEYFETSPVESAAVYSKASPAMAESPRVPLLLVHGEEDDRVPPEHTRCYIWSLDKHTQHTELFVPGLDHFGIIDPSAEHWDAVTIWMGNLLSDSRPK